MYSPEIQKALKKKKIRPGNRILLKKSGRSHEGVLIPKTDSGSPDSIVLKLDSGYNIGLEFKGSSVSKIKSAGQRLGKTEKSLLNLKFNPKKPRISLISSGGTIASRVDYKTGGVTAVKDPREFLHNVPELKDIAFIKNFETPFTKMSEDMDFSDWAKIAKLASKELNKKEIQGVVVTHGTDALHFTAAALSFFLQNLGKPVVLTGAQKSSDRGSSDTGMNLICSAHASISNIAEVGVCMHGSINDDFCFFTKGTKVKKMHTVRRDAFRPINDLPLAKIYPSGQVTVQNKNHTKRDNKKRAELDTRFEPKVALLKAYPGSDPGIIDFYLKSGFRGFVIESMGLGHVPTLAEKSWIPKIKNSISSGAPVVITSQATYGRVNPRVYSNLRLLHQAGAIPGEDLLPETAYVKLGWVLGRTKNPEKARKEMLTNYAGEITKRSLQETFLY